MTSKKLILAIPVVLVASFVRAAGPTPPPTLTSTTLQMYDSKNKLVGTPLPFTPTCTQFNFDFFDACSDYSLGDPLPINRAATVAMKYSGGGSFTLNIAQLFEWPISPTWVPNQLFYVLPNCSSQAYMDIGYYPVPVGPATMTQRFGAIGGGVTGGNPVYVSAMNPQPVELSYKSYSFEYGGCFNSTGEISNAVAVSPTNINLDSIWTPPFHLQ